MRVPGIAFQLLHGGAAAQRAAERDADLLALRAEVCGTQGGQGTQGTHGTQGGTPGTPGGTQGGQGGQATQAGHGTDDPAAAARRLNVRRRQPGFVLAEARHGEYLVAYASGLPLRPSTSWWKDLTTALPDDLTTEYPGRTFALTEILVRASWRRQGIGRALHDLILDGRPEERATVTLDPAAAAAQAAFRRWGWRKVARTRRQGPRPVTASPATASPATASPATASPATASPAPLLDVLLTSIPAANDTNRDYPE